jgi:site-specific DNA-methyltransferase (adenine-specific)
MILHGDCLEHLLGLPENSVDMAYLDPPFFTNRTHSATTRDLTQVFSFADTWQNLAEYAEFMRLRLLEVHRVLKPTASVFVHCDKSANFLLRVLLNEIFGAGEFRSEIIWTYKRWSNSAKGLLPAHQTIFFYSKTANFKFNPIYTPYSETTNLDQILQRRSRDQHGVSSYATDDEGNVIFDHHKQGVPLSDVWEIPFLNPKAKERTGYPTQKPVLLLERMIELVTDTGDTVLDPFCGSGTTLVAAALLDRKTIGIDQSLEAVELSRKRFENPEKTESVLLKNGKAAFENADQAALDLLVGLDVLPVQRNAGIDAFLQHPNGLVPIRVQRKAEPLLHAANALTKAALSKNLSRALLVRTQVDEHLFVELELPKMVLVVDALGLQIKQLLEQLVYA